MYGIIKMYHTLQCIQYNSCGKGTKLLRTLNKKRKSYISRKNDIKTVIHWGQRKLFISELEFLTKYDGDTVLYVGSAPVLTSSCLLNYLSILNLFYMTLINLII